MQLSKRLLLATTAAVTALAASSTIAFAADAANDATEVQQVVVTGSRIPRPNLDQPTPVSVLTNEQIQSAGISNLGDIIAQVPALGFDGTIRANANSGGQNAGLNQPNLRNLGINRTLTLVDGKRHVGGDAGSVAVDLNSIPAALVDHVEVTTGGASAIYGSDAVSGVVNIITKKTFTGVEGQVEYGTPTAGSFGQNYSAYVTAGGNFNQDRGNIAVTAFYDRSEQVLPGNVHGFANYGTIVNPADCATAVGPDGCHSPIRGDGKPDHLSVPNVLSEYIGSTTVLLDAFTFSPLFTFDNKGNPINQQTRTGYNSFAFGSFAGPCATCFTLEDYIKLQPPVDRKGLDIKGRYEIAPNLNFTMDVKYVRTDVKDEFQPSFTFGDYQLQADNAFITPAIAARLTGLTPDVYPFISRFLTDLGDRGDYVTRETVRAVAGLDGKFGTKLADINWDASVNYGQTSNDFRENNLRLTGNFIAALDSVIDPATGQAACRINVPSAQGAGFAAPDGLVGPASSCVPYNPFGQTNSAAALNYIRYNAHESHKISQGTFDLNFNFDSSKVFQFQGGPIGFAAGYEYRKEESSNRNDPVIQQNVTEDAASPNAGGGFNVHEVYLETSLPVFRHLKWIDELTLDGAVREAHYSTVGDVNAYKVGGVYAPIRDIKLRATYSRAVRAPNIVEAFLPASPGFTNITDPCDVQNIGQNPNRTANCAAAGVPANFNSNTNASIVDQSSGNPNLKPETSKSYTVGLVLQPSFMPGFSFSADYYNIDITNAITLVATQDIINNCYDSPGGLDQTYCTLLTRKADGNINFVKTTYLNAASESTHGVDFQVNYTRGIGDLTSHVKPIAFLDGRMTASMSVNWLMALRNAPFQQSPGIYHRYEGTLGTPDIKGTLNLGYAQGPWTFDWSTRFLSRAALFNRDPSRPYHSEDISPAYVHAFIYHNLSVRYAFDGKLKGVEAFGGINNLFDDRYPAGLFGANGNGASEASYDLLGRFIFAGVKIRH